MDKLAVNFGAEISKIVPGYVSTGYMVACDVMSRVLTLLLQRWMLDCHLTPSRLSTAHAESSSFTRTWAWTRVESSSRSPALLKVISVDNAHTGSVNGICFRN
jgi:hypothetical protein